MFKKFISLWILSMLFYLTSFSQVDTTFIYKTGMPYGTLDIRIAKSSTRYYYLEEGKTFSFRESAPGVKTDSFRDMTSWDSSPYTQGNLREKNGNNSSFIMNYRLLLPVNYNAAYQEGYPIIIMTHGLGERGNCWENKCYWDTRAWKPGTNSPAAPTSVGHNLMNNDHNLLHGGSIHLAMRNAAGSKLPNDPSLPEKSFPGFVLFPQNLNGWDGGQAQDVIRIIRLLVKKYKIDPDRIYIHGLSNGGGTVFDIIKRAPWLFSAAAGMSAVNDASIISSGMAPKIATIPLWFFQGGKDKAPTPSKTRGYVKSFREAGLTVRYNEYPNLGHGTWNTAYKEPDFFSWLRSQHKSKIHVFADNPTLCTTTGQGVKMHLAEGFMAYQWQHNGATISGATSATYTATTTGTYRARFSRLSTTPAEAQWNEWSAPVTVVSSNPAQAQIAQQGTVILKDLNNYAYAHLSSVAQADHYYWYKDGARIDLSGSVDDTVRHVKLAAGDCTGNCAGNGQYTLVTAGFNNCPSPPSETKYIFFNNQAPVNITAPSTLTSGTITNKSAVLNWTDVSTNETGFELWRRKKAATTYGQWAMATLTTANVSTFNDAALEPSSIYQYKIRAVSNAGRSDYTPLSSTQYLTVETGADTQNPTAPQNLVANNTAIREIILSWNASTDNTGIREYVITYGSESVSTQSPATTYKLEGLALSTEYAFTVKAKDLGNNLSTASNTASANTYVNGLYYEHTTGAFSDIDAIDWDMDEFIGKVDNFTLTPRTQDDYYNFEFEGFLYITTAGSYQFQTTSDDGSRFTLDGTMVVDNDGLHSTKTVTGQVLTLTSGAHFLNVKYFDDTGGQNLTVRYLGPDTGGSFIAIPNSALRSGDTGTSARMADASEPAAARTEAEETDDSPLDMGIYPNPLTTEELTLQVTATENIPVQVNVYDFMGNTYYENMMEPAELLDGVKITPLQKLNKGMYVVIIRQGGKTTRKVLVVQ